MWYCPKCGLKCRNKDVFCHACGTPKPGAARTAVYNNPDTVNRKRPTEEVSSGKRGKSGKKTVVIIAAAVVAALLVAALVFVIGGHIIIIRYPDSIEITCKGHTIKELQMFSEEECEIKAVFSPEKSNAEPEWSTSDKRVVLVKAGDNNSCRLYAKDAGDAEITVRCGEAKKVLRVSVSPSEEPVPYFPPEPAPVPEPDPEPVPAPEPMINTKPLTDIRVCEDSNTANGKDIVIGTWSDFTGTVYQNSVRYWVIKASGYNNEEHSVYALSHNYNTIQGTFALDTETKPGGNCWFEIYGDGKLIYTSGTITSSYSEHFELDVSDFNYLKISCITNANVFSYGIVSAELTY